MINKSLQTERKIIVMKLLMFMLTMIQLAQAVAFHSTLLPSFLLLFIIGNDLCVS